MLVQIFAKRLTNNGRIAEHPSDIRLKQNDIGSSHGTIVVLAPYRSRQISLGNLQILRLARIFAHIGDVLAQ